MEETLHHLSGRRAPGGARFLPSTVRESGPQIILWCSTSPPPFSARSAESWVRSSVFGIQGALGPLLGAQDSVLCSGWGAFCSMLDTENLT